MRALSFLVVGALIITACGERSEDAGEVAACADLGGDQDPPL